MKVRGALRAGRMVARMSVIKQRALRDDASTLSVVLGIVVAVVVVWVAAKIVGVLIAGLLPLAVGGLVGYGIGRSHARRDSSPPPAL